MSADTTNAEQQLLSLYDRIADAPDAIGRLRRFVLDLAVRGKLVAQDPDDEPASELLKQAAAEKERLVKAGEIRKPRNLSNGEELRPPFEIPATWRWCRLDTIGAIIGGGTPVAGNPTNFAAPGEGVPWLTPADLGDHRDLYISRGARDLSQKGLQSSSATLMPTGTVLFTSRAPIGYVAISTNPISTNQGFKSIVPYVADCSHFIALAMQAFASEIDAKAPGTTFKEVSGKIVAGIAFPLPPLAEQHRIVTKVEELRTLLDRLEAIRTTAEFTRGRLTTASFKPLTLSDTTPETFPTRARFALDALPRLTARTDQIQSVRQTILNLAVRGKLVEQEPNDEPASELLKRIEAEKAWLVEMGKLKRKKAFPSVNDEPFPLPRGWCWVRLGEVGITQTGSTPSKNRPDYYGSDVPFIRPGDLYPDRVDYSGVGLSRAGADFSGRMVDDGSILMVCIGTIGKCQMVDRAISFNQQINAVTPYREFSPRFVLLAVQSDFFQELAWAASSKTTIAILNKGNWEKLPIPLPPVAEQHRIAARVDELMALCDRLEAALTTANIKKQRLLEGLLDRALAIDRNSREAA